ncbi:hypothetical protein [Candidatus Methanomassiliicoccus intestinalis]|uniref:hypothetical protein n=1 Tax=Candidatus Methanomassiliicoccus intestinalis TaxID=1406512 RepID=UPI0037DD5229
MGKNKDLHLYSIEKVRECCESKGLVPGLVKGTDSKIQFTKGNNNRLNVISWDDFESILEKKKLEVWGTPEGWMKIFSAGEEK